MKKKDYIPYKYQRDFGKTTPRMLEYLFNGGRDKEIIKQMCFDGLNLIDQKYDCSDFRVEKYVRVLYSFKDVVGKEIEDLITTSLFKFPFDDCEGNSMCTWTENHQLIFSVSEYLLGQMYPEQIMYDGSTGKQLQERAKIRLEAWCEYIYRFGLSEFGSCNYYPETFAALGNIIEFAEDKLIKNKFRIVLDLLCYDVMSTTLPNLTYNKANARSYVDNKVNFYNYMEPIIKGLLGQEVKINKEREACFYLMLRAKDENGNPLYTLPKVFKDIFETKERIIKESNGLELCKYKENGLLKYSEDNVLYTLASGALIDPLVAKNVVKYFNEKKMWQNAMIQGLRPFKGLIVNCPPLYKIIKSFVHTSADDMAFGNGNTYTFIKNNYSISSLQKYHIYSGSFQQSTHMLNLDGLSVFTNSPSKSFDKKGSPDYWIGSSTNPHCIQNKNNLVLMYKFNKNSGYGKNKTHLYFPIEQFEQVDLNHIKDGYLFGRYHSINVMVKTNMIEIVDSSNDISFMQDGKLEGYVYKKYDFINNFKGHHYYLFNVDDELSFDEYIDKCLKENCLINKDCIKFNGINFRFGKDCFINNKKIIDRYHRFEGDYVENNKYDFSKDVPLKFVSKNNSLTIDFKNYTRKEN